VADMAQKIKLEDKEYDIEQLSEAGQSQFTALKFVTERIQELNNHQALLQRAKNSYVDSLKKEMLSERLVSCSTIIKKEKPNAKNYRRQY
jgi:hypothetical protein